MQLLEKIILKM